MDITVKDVILLVQSVGFPILIAIWFMFRTETIINKNTEVTQSLVVIETIEVELLRALAAQLGINTTALDRNTINKS
jgi:hypothetical protein